VKQAQICMAILLSVSACGIGDESSTRRQGGAGASCLSTNDCKVPYECFGNVCRGSIDGAIDGDAAAYDIVAERGDHDTVLSGDLPRLDDTPFEDVGRTEDDISQVEVSPPTGLDTVNGLDSDASNQGPNDVLNPIGDCEELGIAATWKGTFTGDIDYDLGQEIPGLVEKDILPVDGSLSFSIQCIEAKLVVLGEMDGVALGLNPFTLTLQGTYSPSTGALDAQMTDGIVTIFGLVEVYFEGEFSGQLISDAEFSGVWDGDAVGNNVDLNAVAIGTGTWFAEPE